MPILVRPVREQIEHDRVIRQLQDRWRRKYRADINPGEERTAFVQAGSVTFYPDLVLTTEGQRKPSAVVEVETGESVNHLEAMSQWATFAKSRIPFYLFVPAGSLDSARRLVADHQIELTELWTYFVIGEQIRFTPVIRAASSAADAVADRPLLPEKRAEKRGDKPTEKAAAEKPVDKAPEKAAERAAEKSADKVDKIIEHAAEPEEKEATTREEPRARKRLERSKHAERAAGPASKAPTARRASAGRPSAPPPRRKAGAGKRAVTPKRGVRAPAKRAVAAKRPARGAAKHAAAAVRRPAKTSRPAAKRARAQKRR